MQRDAAVVHPIPQKMARTSSGIKSPNAAPGLPTAERMMTGVGCPDASAARSARLGMTKVRATKKIKPQIQLRMMVKTIALGTWMLGCLTSSHMLIPVSTMLQQIDVSTPTK